MEEEQKQILNIIVAVCLVVLFVATVFYAGKVGEKRGFDMACKSIGYKTYQVNNELVCREGIYEMDNSFNNIEFDFLES